MHIVNKAKAKAVEVRDRFTTSPDVPFYPCHPFHLGPCLIDFDPGLASAQKQSARRVLHSWDGSSLTILARCVAKTVASWLGKSG